MKSGTIFDNLLITDDEAYAEEFGNETWGKTKDPEKKMKEEASFLALCVFVCLFVCSMFVCLFVCLLASCTKAPKVLVSGVNEKERSVCVKELMLCFLSNCVCVCV